MEEAKDYKKYLKALKEATRKKGKSKKGTRDIVGLMGMRSVLKRKRGGDTPGLKDYAKKTKSLTKKSSEDTLGKLSKMRGSISDAELSYAVSMVPSKKNSDGTFEKSSSSNNSINYKGNTYKKLGDKYYKVSGKNKGGAMLKNPGKADLDKDGKLSGYEKKRGMAIEKSMSIKPKKAALGAMLLGKAMKKDKDMKPMPLGMAAMLMKKKKMKEILGAAKGKSIRGYGAARTSGMGLQDEAMKPGKLISKKMGGGMMKPMGYKKGSSIMARGCKLGRKKATKLS